MRTDISSQQPAEPHQAPDRSSLLAMLEARSVAIVGASKREGSFGERMLAEAEKSPAKPVIYPVNPRYAEIGGRPCHSSLADLPEPVDLALLGVPDAALEEQLTLAASQGCRPLSSWQRARGPSGGHQGRPCQQRGWVPGGRPPASTADAAELRPSLRQRLTDRQISRDGAVRRWMHGVREREPRPAGHGLRRFRPAARRTGRARDPFGLGVRRCCGLAAPSASRSPSPQARNWSPQLSTVPRA